MHIELALAARCLFLDPSGRISSSLMRLVLVCETGAVPVVEVKDTRIATHLARSMSHSL